MDTSRIKINLHESRNENQKAHKKKKNWLRHIQQAWFAAAVCLDRFGNNWKSSEKTLFQVPCLSNLIIIKFQFKADTLSDTLSEMYEKYNLISFVMNYCSVLSY